jgi:hypothetical protein
MTPACHHTMPHTPSALDIERNQHFAKLIAIRGGGVMASEEPVVTWPNDESRRGASARVNAY